MITLSIILIFSLAINAVLIWYCRRLAKQFLIFTENVVNLEDALGAFDEHLTGVHELETFYGDETLGALIRHSKVIVETIRDFYGDFTIEDDPEELNDDS